MIRPRLLVLTLIALATGLVSGLPRALAAEHVEQLIFEYGGGNADLRRTFESRLPTWVATLKTDLAQGPEWDENEHGPFGLCVERLTVESHEVDPKLHRATLTVRFQDEELRSGRASLTALGKAIVRTLSSKMSAAASDVRHLRTLGASVTAERLEEEQRSARAELAASEKERGDAPERERLDREQIAEISRQLTQVGIDRAVAEKELEAARAAVARARQVLALERAVADLERVIEETARDRQESLRARLDALLRSLDDARATAPPLEDARARLFDLEIRVVGLEVRESRLGETLVQLRASTNELAPVARRQKALRSRLAELDDAVRDARKALRDAQPVFTASPLTVIRPIGDR